jgi:hypothetical protein
MFSDLVGRTVTPSLVFVNTEQDLFDALRLGQVDAILENTFLNPGTITETTSTYIT